LHKIILLSSFFLINTLNADDFSLVKPISVEKAPVYHVKTPTQKKLLAAKKEKIKAKKKTESEEFAKSKVLDIKFKSQSAALDKNALDKVFEFAQYLKKNKSYQVVLYGYTDSIGSKHENLLLSQKRVNAIVDKLISQGISSTRLTAVGKGEQDPIGDNMYKEGREKNRRIEALIIK